MRRAPPAVLLLAAIASCGVGGHLAEVRVAVPAPFGRPVPPPDAIAARLLAGGEPLVAVALVASLDIHAEPGTRRPYMHLDTENPWGQALRLPVERERTDDDGGIWLGIRLPIWPNGQEGWVPASEVRLAAAAERLVVDLSDRTLTRSRDGTFVQRMRVAIGSPATPTPTGRFYVWAKVPTGLASGPYGTYILGLSGFSEAIRPWDEWPGEPRLAIHGTDDPGEVGRAVSHGCIRVGNALMRRLRDVPMGTPVVIRP